MISGTTTKSKSILNGIAGSTSKLKLKLDPLKQFELAKNLHLTGGGAHTISQSKLASTDFSRIQISDVSD